MELSIGLIIYLNTIVQIYICVSDILSYETLSLPDLKAA